MEKLSPCRTEISSTVVTTLEVKEEQSTKDVDTTEMEPHVLAVLAISLTEII
jgi:hypothetical protein